MKYRLVLLSILLLAANLFAQSTAVVAVASLSDPVKLATLGARAANPRLKKVVYWLADARSKGKAPENVIDAALQRNGTPPALAPLVKTNLLRNLMIADELGLLTPDNMERLRTGHAPFITLGPYTGEDAEVDHVILFAVAPEIGNNMANLELLPRTLNRRKGEKVGQRQGALAQQLYEAGALSEAVLERIKMRQTTQ